MIKGATFTSVWDNGCEITTNCFINMETNEVFGIEFSEVDESCEILEREFVTIDGNDFPVFQISDITEEDNEYWYD